MPVRSPGGEDLLEEEMATHSSILAWKIPWTEKPGGLQSMGQQSQIQPSMHAHTHTFIYQTVQQNVNHSYRGGGITGH